MYRNRLLALAGSALLSLAACSELPQESMNGAKSALEAARTAEAQEYAPEAWRLAEDTLGSAMAEVEAQNEKLVLFRSYTAASELLEKAREQANAATIEATEEREQTRMSAESKIAEAEAAIAEARAALESAPRAKGMEGDLLAMEDELTAMTASLEGAREAFAGGRFLMAEARAESVTDGARAIAADIAVGNVVGSNVFNLLGVLGLSAMVARTPLSVPGAALRVDFPVMIVSAALCLVFFHSGRRLSRGEGAVFLAAYVLYVTYLFLSGGAEPA